MASGNASLDILTTTYKQVIEDVVRNMREEYLNEGADAEMLEELKTLWLTKLNQSGAVSRPPRAEPPPRPSHTQLPELAQVIPPSKTIPPSAGTTSSPPTSYGGQHQQHVSVTPSSTGKTMSPSRPPPALLHVPQPSDSALDTPPQQRQHTESGVIQQAPPRPTQQATPTSTANSATNDATSSAAQVSATPLSVQTTPPVMLHPSMLAALQQQANQSASTNTAAAAPSVMEALQQSLALGGGVSTASGVTATAAVNPFGALNIMNPAATGMIPVQTAQGTMLIPLQTFMALNQLKQAQQAQQQQQQAQLAAALASAGGGGASSSDGASAAATNQQQGEKEVHQVDGFPPELPLMCNDGSRRSECQARELDTTSVDLGLSISSEGTLVGQEVMSGEQEVMSGEQEVMPDLQIFSSKVPTDFVRANAKPSTSSQSQSNCTTPADGLPVGVVKSHSHANKVGGGEISTSATEYIIQLDGPISPVRGRSSKVIVQVDGGRDNGSSSEDDSDVEEDSSEDDEDGPGISGALVEDNDDDPLNSDDDIDANSDDGAGDFETEDTIVCQWEKVYRVKNKWKFQLKDGVMHVGGYDYVFHKANGEADW